LNQAAKISGEKHILLVEDDGIVIEDIRACLGRMGHVLSWVYGSGDACVAAGVEGWGWRPDLALLDVQLPGELDGIDVARRLAGWGVPVVFVTGTPEESVLLRAGELAPAGFVRKPFGEGELGRVIAGVLGVAGRVEDGMVGRRESLEVLARLAGGFAHDFNNLLTVLLGNLSLLEGREGLAGDIHLATAKGATLEAQGLVQQLMPFARGASPMKERIELSGYLGELLGRHARVGGVSYGIELAGEIWLEADRDQLGRALVNLLRNAEQGLGAGGGRIRMEVGKGRDGVGPGLVEVAVIDDGEGIAEGDLARVKEPFFTTRKDRHASGLGLAVCDMVAAGHGGRLEIWSRPGEGTRASLWLPMAGAELGGGGGFGVRGPAGEVGRGLGERILILEDEPLVARVMQMSLERAGYAVELTERGEETVESYRRGLEEGRCAQLVVMDLSVPGGMGGAETLGRLREIDPLVKAIVSSGYSDDPIMSEHERHGFSGRLAKPYEPDELVQLVGEVLGVGCS
jgi:two-component system, cell cycle sensor histidine kinase and response regulator CckA